MSNSNNSRNRHSTDYSTNVNNIDNNTNNDNSRNNSNSRNEINNNRTFNNLRRYNNVSTRKRYYLPLPFISDQFNYRIKKLFKKYNYDVQVANKSTNTLRKNLNRSIPKLQYKCNKRNKCATQENNLCYKLNVIYEIKCKICHHFYIGSTNQYLHDRVHQHLQNKEGSINQHLVHMHKLSNFDDKAKNISVRTLYQCPSMKDLLPIEATYTKPHIGKIYLLNRKEEMKDIISLLN